MNINIFYLAAIIRIDFFKLYFFYKSVKSKIQSHYFFAVFRKQAK